MTLTTLQRSPSEIPTPGPGEATIFVDAGVVKVKLPDGSTLDVGGTGGGGGEATSSNLAWNMVSGSPAYLEVGMITAFNPGNVNELIFPDDPADGDRVAVLCTGASDGGANNARLYLSPTAAAPHVFEDYDTRETIADNFSDQSPEATSGTRIRAKSFYLEYQFDANSNNGVWRLVGKEFVSPSRGSIVIDGADGSVLSSTGGLDIGNAGKSDQGDYYLQINNLPVSYPNGVCVTASAGFPTSTPYACRMISITVQPGDGYQFGILIRTFDPSDGVVQADVDRLYVHISC